MQVFNHSNPIILIKLTKSLYDRFRRIGYPVFKYDGKYHGFVGPVTLCVKSNSPCLIPLRYHDEISATVRHKMYYQFQRKVFKVRERKFISFIDDPIFSITDYYTNGDTAPSVSRMTGEYRDLDEFGGFLTNVDSTRIPDVPIDTPTIIEHSCKEIYQGCLLNEDYNLSYNKDNIIHFNCTIPGIDKSYKVVI
jgi:hypothetical protein